MSAAAAAGRRAPAVAGEASRLATDVLSHLAAQIGSAERLLAIVLEQGAAIRRKDIHEVVRSAGLLQGELARREEIDARRSELLDRSAALLGLAPSAVTVSALGTLMSPTQAAQAAARSTQLRGLLHELQREHMLNRALMKVELAFLDHLLSTLAPESAPAYGTRGAAPGRPARPSDLHVFDAEA